MDAINKIKLIKQSKTRRTRNQAQRRVIPASNNRNCVCVFKKGGRENERMREWRILARGLRGFMRGCSFLGKP